MANSRGTEQHQWKADVGGEVSLRVNPPSPFSSTASPTPLLYSMQVETETTAAENQHQHQRRERGGGDVVSVTWEDLCVWVHGRKGEKVPILSGISGFAEPGDVLAIMGPSGCGKSTLLNTLAGRLGSKLEKTGDILINGQKQPLAFGISAYVTQEDVLMTTLTVREAVYYSAELQLPSSLSKADKIFRAEDTIREMGLLAAGDTIIGRVSGGQRRRVSICVEMLTRPRLLFLDEPTSGLDSAASYHVLGRIAKLARREAMTVVASVHQPSGEVLEMFNGLCLLAYGKTVYFGPTSLANQFFALNGFPCPSMTNPSDHYLRTINKDFDQDVEEGLEAMPIRATKAIETLVDSYKSSTLSHQVLHHIAEIHEMGGGLVKKGSRASFTKQCLVLTRRSFVNMYRDPGYYWLRLVIYMALGIGLGTMYHGLDHSYGSTQDRCSLLMFVSGFLTFMAIGGFPSFVEDMKIFARERLNGHYGVTSFVIGNTLSSAPFLALISAVPGATAYYLAGLRGSFPHFAYFLAVLFTCLLLVESLMMIVASVVPNFLMGIITGAGIQGVMLLDGGFFRLPNNIPKPVWKYPMYFISFHKYSNQGLYKNEFLGQTFSREAANSTTTLISGEEILRNVWQLEMGHSKWIDLVFLCGMVVIYRLLFLVIVKMAEKLKPALKELMMVKAPKQQ